MSLTETPPASRAQRTGLPGKLSRSIGNRSKSGRVFTLALILPAILYFGVWVFLPVGYGIYLSTTDASLLAPPSFVGAANYVQLVTSGDWWATFGRTFAYTAEVVIPTLVLSFIIARVVTKCRRWRPLLMTIYFLPYVVPGVVAALVFSLLFQRYGLINTSLHLHLAWLADSHVALYAVSVTTIWSMLGYYVIILMAGFQQVPAEVIEAATLDGANTAQMIRHIEIPSLRPVLLFSTISSTAAVMTNFGIPFVMTNGGPSNATLTVPLEIYNQAFKYSSAGVGEAEAVMLLLVAMILALLQVRFLFGGGSK
jgi:multiple sugar transport system permease protein